MDNINIEYEEWLDELADQFENEEQERLEFEQHFQDYAERYLNATHGS